MIDDKMLIPELSVPWEESLKLVGEDGSEFLSDFCIMMDRTGRWHCIGIGGQGHIQDSFLSRCIGRLSGTYDLYKQSRKRPPGDGMDVGTLCNLCR